MEQQNTTEVSTAIRLRANPCQQYKKRKCVKIQRNNTVDVTQGKYALSGVWFGSNIRL